MRDTLRDFMIAVAAAAALFAAGQSWSNGRQLSELSGQVAAIQAAVNAHVNAPGIHGAR